MEYRYILHLTPITKRILTGPNLYMIVLVDSNFVLTCTKIDFNFDECCYSDIKPVNMISGTTTKIKSTSMTYKLLHKIISGVKLAI